MKIGLILGRQNEKEIYTRVSRSERERNRKQIEIIKTYRAEQRAKVAQLAKEQRRRELVAAGFNPPEHF